MQYLSIACIYFLYRLVFPFITLSLLDPITSNFQLWPLTIILPVVEVLHVRHQYVLISISPLFTVELRSKHNDDDIYSVKSTFYVTSGLVDMTSLSVPDLLRISLLFTLDWVTIWSERSEISVWLWGNVKYHVTLKVTLAFEVNGNVNAYFFFLYHLVCQFITPSIIILLTLKFQLWSLKRNCRFRRYYIINVFRLKYLHYLLSDWDLTSFGKSRMTTTLFRKKKYISMLLLVSQTWRH